MKKILLTLCLAASAMLAGAQIPNAGFESWQNGFPAGYITSNLTNLLGGYPGNVTQSSEFHTGTSAIKLETIAVQNLFTQAKDTLAGLAVTGSLTNNNLVTGFPYSGRPSSFSGYFKSTIPKNDTAFILVGLYKYNSQTHKRDSLGGAFFYTISTVQSYTMFNANFIYTSSPLSPDTALIIMGSSGKKKIAGSVLFVDDLMFNGVTATNQPLLANFTPAFPNPVKDELHLTNLPTTAYFVEIRDMSGKLIDLLNADENVQVRVQNYPDGLYHYSVMNESHAILYKDKFTVIK